MEHCRNPQRQTTADCARGGPLTRVAKDAQRLKTGRRNSSSKLTPKCSTHPLMKAQDRSPCQVRALPQSFIVRSMNSRNRNRVWAWLLCALLFWLTANPPHIAICVMVFSRRSRRRTSPSLSTLIRSRLIDVMGSALVADSTASRMSGCFSSA